jgi:pyroglutamyl-peptidase
MKVLVTAFDPFDTDKVNPAFEAVKLLPAEIAGAAITTLEVPTVFAKGAAIMEAKMREINPDLVICVGQAGGRAHVTLERVAINLIEARVKDNAGNQPFDAAIKEDGENAYFTNLPLKAMVANMHAKGLPGSISYTAGTFVCNEIMYQLLYLIEKEFTNVRGGFIHVPFSPDQTITRPVGTPCMSLETIADSLVAAIEAAVTHDADISGNAGTTH